MPTDPPFPRESASYSRASMGVWVVCRVHSKKLTDRNVFSGEIGVFNLISTLHNVSRYRNIITGYAIIYSYVSGKTTLNHKLVNVLNISHYY